MTESLASTAVPIRLDRDRLDRTWLRLIVGTVLVIVVLLAAASVLLMRAGAGLIDVMPVLLVIPLGTAYVLVTFGLTWRRLRRITVPLVLDQSGITLRSPFGEVVAPWSGVESASIEPRLLGAWLRVRVTPGSFTTTVTRRYYLRALEAQGFRYALRMLEPDADQLRAAFEQQSGGRVTLA